MSSRSPSTVINAVRRLGGVVVFRHDGRGSQRRHAGLAHGHHVGVWAYGFDEADHVGYVVVQPEDAVRQRHIAGVVPVGDVNVVVLQQRAHGFAQQRRQLLLNAARMQDVQALIELGFDAVANERLKEASTYFAAAAPNSVVAAQNAALIQTRQNEQPVDCKIQGGGDLPDSVLLSSAQALHRGSAGVNGCSVNYAEAIRLYNLAANKGNVPAKRMLSLIYSKSDVSGNINIAWMQQLANMNAANLSLSPCLT
jgi:TPR repeat protein